MSSFSFENVANIDLKLHIGKSYSYSRFADVLGIRRQSGVGRDRQLKKLQEHIDFKIENGKYIILGSRGSEIKLEREFLTLKDFYNKGVEIDRYEVLKFVIMNFLKDELRGKTSDKWREEYITTYDRLGVDLGLVNKLFYHTRFKYIDVGKLIKIRPSIVGTMIASTRRSYTNFIKKGLESLRDEGFIEYENSLWGLQESFVSKDKEKVHKNKIYSDGIKTNKQWIRLSKEQEKVYRKAIEENRREYSKFMVSGESVEEMFSSKINKKMYNAYGIKYIGERAEIKFTSKCSYEFLEKLKEVGRERDWLGKQFYERLKESREKAFKEDENKKNLEDYVLLLELFIKKMRNNPREELRWAYERLSDFFGSKSGRSIETGEVEYRRV